MSDLEEARKRWTREAPLYRQFGKLIESKLVPELKKRGIKAEVSSREKEMHSLIKKLIKKPHITYESMGDKCGVRTIVRFKPEVDVALGLAQKLFSCGEPDHKSVKLAEDKVGYLSVHVDVQLHASDPDAKMFPPDRFSAELQVRTLAQHLWAEMAHDTSYKGTGELEEAFKRRINLMAGLIEVADSEFARVHEEISRRPGIVEQAVLSNLEPFYFRLTSVAGDHDLSLEVIHFLLPLYNENPEQIKERIEKLFHDKESTLISVFESETADGSNASAFLFQPEVLLLYERLTNDRYRLVKEFSKLYPVNELERVANAFGISFD